jgi:hypothetical protein
MRGRPVFLVSGGEAIGKNDQGLPMVVYYADERFINSAKAPQNRNARGLIPASKCKWR